MTSQTELEYWTNRFKESEKRQPTSQLELMQYASIMQQQQKEHANFWKGVFGL